VFTAGPRRGPRSFSFSWWTSDAADETGPPLAAVSSTLTGAVAAMPLPARGRMVGRLEIIVPGGSPRPLTLRAPRTVRSPVVLLRRGRLRVTLRTGRRPQLRVNGLPAGARAARLELSGTGRDLLRPRACRARSTGVRSIDVLRTPDGQTARLVSGFIDCRA
jgi:hypothetical protein